MIPNTARIKTHRTRKSGTRIVKAVHGLRKVKPDPQFELDMAAHLKDQLSHEQLLEAFSDHARGTNPIDLIMRRVCLRALVKTLGAGANIRKNVSVIHPETFEIEGGAFIGEQTIIRSRFDGRCMIGEGVWIGPQSWRKRNPQVSRSGNFRGKQIAQSATALT